jgi:hypothetical protein
MGWIKRNLFFVVGGVLALVLLGGAGFFIYSSWSSNSAASEKLNEIYSKLADLSQSPQQPGNGTTDNAETAKQQAHQEQQWIANASKYFTPIPAIPPGTPVPSADFAEALRQTMDSLQHEAEGASVTLPPQCSFSFSAQRALVRFAGSLDPLAVQLGEVKAISEVLFAARINSFDSIQRVRVSDDDTQGPQADYTSLQPKTNDLAIITPYVVTFRSFTPELARALAGFASAPYPFIVRSVLVQPAGPSATSDANGVTPGLYGGMPGADGLTDAQRAARYRYANPGQRVPPPTMAQPQSLPGKGGLQTVLKEQLLTIKLEVDIVRLVPKS